MDSLMPDLSSLGVQRSGGQSISRGEASGSEMPLMLPQRDELEKVTQKISEVEQALAGNRTYLGITDTSLLVKELHSLRKKEEQIRDLQLLLLRNMGPSLAGSNFGMPQMLVRAGVGGGIPAGNPVPQATTGSAHPTAVLGAPVGAASLVPHPHQTVSNSSGSNVTADPNAISPGEDANASCDITGGVDTDGEGRDKRRRTSTAVGSPAATVAPHADEDIDSGRREGSPIEGSLSPGPSTFSGQSPERREEYEDGGDDGGQSAGVELDAAGEGAEREGNSSYRSGSLPPVHADLVIGADGRQSKRAGEVWRVTPCREMGCTKRPSFGLPVDAKASYCGAHKLKDMVLVNRRRRCLMEGCTRQPLYGTDTDRVPVACGAHKAQEHVNVTHRRCAQTGCTTQPVYGDAPVAESERFCPKFCAVHKRPGMVSQKRTRCSTNRCYRRAAYGMRGGEIKVCAEHKQEGMVKITQLQGPRGPPSSSDGIAVTSAGAQQPQSKDSAAVTVESSGGNGHRVGDMESNTPRSGENTRSTHSQPPSTSQQQQDHHPSITGATSGTEAGPRQGGGSSFTNRASSAGVADTTNTGGGAGGGPAGQAGSGNRMNIGRDGGGNGNDEQRSLGASGNYDARRESVSGVGGGSGTSGGLPPSPQQQHQQQQRHRVMHRESLLALPPPPHGPLPLPIPDHQSGRQGRLSSAVGVGGVSGSGEGCDDLPSSHHHGHFQQQQQQQHMEQHYRSQHLQQQQSQQLQQRQQQSQQPQQHLPPLTAATHGGPSLYPQTIPVHQIDHQLVMYPPNIPGGMSHPVALFSHPSGSSIIRGDQIGGMGFRDSS